jgi:hypothetical protein
MKWGCPVCQKKKKLRNVKKFEHYKKPVKYRMLTLSEWKHPSNYANAKEIMTHWGRLRAALRYYHFNLTDYFFVKEYKQIDKKYSPDLYYSLTPSQRRLLYSHLHVLIPLYIDIALVARLWYKATCNTANQVHILKDLDKGLENPMAYLTSYTAKGDPVLGFSKGEHRFGFSRNYKSRQLAYIYARKGTFNYGAEFGSYVPYSSNEGGVFFGSWLKLTKELKEQIQAFYDSTVIEYYNTHPFEQAKKDEYEENESNMMDYRNDALEILYDDLREKKFVGDYVIDNLYLSKRDNPAHDYAMAKVSFFMKALQEDEKNRIYDP